MSRNLYILAATLLLFAVVSGAMTLTSSAWQPGLPGNGLLWKTTALLLALTALITALAAVFTAMFEQVDRRSEERRRRDRDRGH